ncbi:MAG: methionyl-tRNA formyltransferase [Thermodesulfobacteriota bacterium]|nr:methionyl-tRNA formyltransferase [Thermodesulfobacteriota bacterium]
MTTSLNIIFMGTPEFAVPCLKALAASPHSVSLVVTRPDRPKGRGRKLTPPPVKLAAMEFGNTVVQPTSVKDPAFVDALKDVSPDVLVVVAFGSILPKAVLDIPRLGAVNIHPSLLPKYRGPSPIQWAIVCMEAETGVTSMFLDEGMDSGDMILAVKTPIYPEETAGELHDRLAVMGGDLLIETLEQVADGTAVATPQNDADATFAPVLKKSHGRIDWHRSADQIRAMINGMNPWPGAFTFLGDKRLKIWKASAVQTDSGALPGTVVAGFPGEIRVAAGENILAITEIQGESGKRLSAADFLRGVEIPEGSVLA